MNAEEEAMADALAAAILRGDPAAEALLYNRYHRQLMLILQGRGVPKGQQEDIAHEAYIVTLQRLRDGELEQPELLGRYLKRTAINIWLNEMRKHIRHGDVPLDLTDESALSIEPNQVTSIVRDQRAEIVRLIIGELSQERDRLVLQLMFIHDWDKVSICDYLGIESRIFDNVRSRAIKRCQTLIENDPGMKQHIQDVLEGSKFD